MRVQLPGNAAAGQCQSRATRLTCLGPKHKSGDTQGPSSGQTVGTCCMDTRVGRFSSLGRRPFESRFLVLGGQNMISNPAIAPFRETNMNETGAVVTAVSRIWQHLQRRTWQCMVNAPAATISPCETVPLCLENGLTAGHASRRGLRRLCSEAWSSSI